MNNDEREIRELVKTWLDASEKGDLDTVLSLMDDNVIFLVPGREPFGKQEFAATSKKMGSIKMQGTSDVQEVQVVNDWAWIRSSLRVRATTPDGKEVVRSGSTLSILRKNEAGRWVLLRDANLLAPEE